VHAKSFKPQEVDPTIDLALIEKLKSENVRALDNQVV
jgi:hypothetical protein